jgi:hypothetical protein
VAVAKNNFQIALFSGCRPGRLPDRPGKIHRVREEGGIPDDSPFAGVPDAFRSVFS